MLWRGIHCDTRSGGGQRYRFNARSGAEVWRLGVERRANGKLAAIDQQQTMADSNDREIGAAEGRYVVTAVNPGLGDDAFAVPKECGDGDQVQEGRP